MSHRENIDNIRREEWVGLYRKNNPATDRWAEGYGPIKHEVETQARIFAMAQHLSAKGIQGDGMPLFDLLHALDRVTSAAMWVVVHETYARNVYLDGRELTFEDFKPNPEGHTGGALNMVPAYAGYMAINAMTGHTRSWVMGQGHCVAAIDTINLLLSASRLDWASHDLDRQRVILTAIGAYQLEEVLKASARLKERNVPHSVIYMLEPGRFRTPRSNREEVHVAPAELRAELYPSSVPARIFVTHARPEILLGILQPLHTGFYQTGALGFINQGGTLNVPGMLFVNRCNWGHILLEVARVLGVLQEELLTPEELAALNGQASPEGILF